MPISKENKLKYPKNWKQISLNVRALAHNKCEFCGLKNGNDNNRVLAKAEITMLKPHTSKIFDINNFDLRHELKAAFKLNDNELRYIEIYK